MNGENTYWWARFGDFDPGEGVYPHMGQVIAQYRVKRGFPTQQHLATALGCSKRTVEELEGNLSLTTSYNSVERRQILAQILRIPPVLLALDWRFMAYQDNSVEQENQFTDKTSISDEDAFALYEDLLVIGWGNLRNGSLIATANRLDERVSMLATKAQHVPAIQREQWLSLLCRFYQLSLCISIHSMDMKQALHHGKNAIDVALELDNAELAASAFYRRGRVYTELKGIAKGEIQKQKYLALAKEDLNAALRYVERVRTPLKGTIYLFAAELHALDAGSNVLQQKQCYKWYEKVANLIYRGNVEDDGNFLRLNHYALHHEQAKMFLQFHQLPDARNELGLAWKTLQPGVLIWHINTHLTEARLYMAEHDLEGSVGAGIEAFKLAQTIGSQKRLAGVRALFADLQWIDDTNPYVCNLGMRLGLY